jgi:hypothetical protein
VVAVGRAVNPIVQSGQLNGWWFVLAISLGLVALAALGFGKVAGRAPNSRAPE